MDIGKVIGTVVATRKDPTLVGTRLLVIQPVDEKGGHVGEPIIAVDTANTAGYGEFVYTVSGGDAVAVTADRSMPVDIAVVGLVDSITLAEKAQT